MRHIVLQETTSTRKHKMSLPCVVGRSNEADLIFQDSTVSQRHALISEINNQIWIEDLQSSNGVYVNRAKIKEKTILSPGDSVQLGKISFIVSEAEEEISEKTLVLHSLEPKAEWELDRERLKLIYEFVTQFSENQDLSILAEKVFTKLKDTFEQDRSYLALFQEDGTLKPIFSEPHSESSPLSRSIVNRLFQNGESFLLEDALSEESLKQQESIIALRIRSALCVPLIYHDQIYGLVYIDRNIPGAYKQEDLEFLRTIASMLAPLIENARLWSELKNHYASAMDILRETQAKLIDMERRAAYVRLAQAMAHEIRNPLMAIGGLVKRLSPSETGRSDNDKSQAILTLAERVEMVLREVDEFVKTPPPNRKLERIDYLISEVIKQHDWEWVKDGRSPLLSVKTSHVLVPLDADLFKKALSLIFKEIALNVPQEVKFGILLQDFFNELEIVIGDIGENRASYEPFDPELQGKPWSLGLFLNMAHIIISNHGGKLLLDHESQSAFPIVIRMPRDIKI